MRDKLLYVFAAAAALLLSYNLYNVLMVLPPQVTNVGAYKIIYFHVPAAFTAFTGFVVALVASAMYLWKGDFRYDAFAAGVTEVALVFATANLISGMVWARFAWGIWWTWDARLTSMLVCWLIYFGYVMLRGAISEPTQRARFCAVLAIMGTIMVAFVYKSIEIFRTQHPQPVLSIREGGGMSAGLEAPIYWNWVALVLLGTAITMVRMRQEEYAREIDSLRRMAHSH